MIPKAMFFTLELKTAKSRSALKLRQALTLNLIKAIKLLALKFYMPLKYLSLFIKNLNARKVCSMFMLCRILSQKF